MPFIIILFNIFLGLTVFFITNSIISRNKIKNLLKEKLSNLESSKGMYDFKGTKSGKTYLIKIINNYSCAEININSKNYFQINLGAVSSRKSGKKIERVYDLINSTDSDDIVKVYLIYPNSLQLMKVLNECEMKIINGNDIVYGCRFITFDELITNKIEL